MRRRIWVLLALLFLLAASVYALIQIEELKSEWWAAVFPVSIVLAFIVGRKSPKYVVWGDLEVWREDMQTSQIRAHSLMDARVFSLEKGMKADAQRCFERYLANAKLHDDLDKRVASLEATYGLLRARFDQELPKPRSRRPKRGDSK